MNRILEKYKHMAPVIAAEAGTTPNKVIAVLEAMETEMTRNRRCKNAPPPPGSISIGAASRKYDVYNQTITRWVQKGLVPVVLRTRRYKYIDEAALAKLIERYKAAPGQGKQTLRTKKPPAE